MKKFVFILIFQVITFCIYASHDIFPTGAKSAAMANASVTNRDIWCAFNNQAGLAEIRNFTAGVIYENKFLLKELGTKAGVFAIPVNTGTFALSFSQFGFSLYNENKAGLAYAMALGKNFNAGIQIDYLLTQLAENYGRKGLFTFELGLQAKLSEKMFMGAQIFNPLNIKLTDYVEERIPSYIRFGITYIFSPALNVIAEAEKNINNKPIIKMGIEYEMIKNIYIRTGIANNPSVFSFGFGVNLKNLKIDFGTSRHNTLGYSPALSLLYSFGNEK